MRQRRSEPGRRDRLLQVALEVIIARGVAGATYRLIAEAADVPLGSMTYHFTSRDELVLAAFERFAEESFSHLDSATSAGVGDPVERLTQMVVSEFNDQPRERILLAEMYVLAFRDERYAALMRRWTERSQAAIERQLPGLNGRALNAVREGLTLQRYFFPGEVDADLVHATLSAVACGTASSDSESRPKSSAPKDYRGPVVRTVETAQTFLSAAEVDALVGDYLAGMSVKALAERYGIHRATVFAHLRRRNVPSRRPGLGIDEKAEAVRLARAGISMRAIGRRMGVDRKAVRAALVEAGLIADKIIDGVS